MRRSREQIVVTKTWSVYWKSYTGVTRIGAWSQRIALDTVFQLITEFGISASGRVLDVGCGEGRTLAAFRNHGFTKTIGIDNTKESLEICRKNGLRPGKDVFRDDAYGTKYRSRTFDLVFSEGILEHFRDPQPLIAEMVRISRRYILLIQPNHYSPYGKLIAVAGNLLRNNVREYAYPLRFFESSFAAHGYIQRAVRHTPLHEFWILLYERGYVSTNTRK